ncbi:hypothetical protein PSV3_00245 [Septimatrevirus PSV33]|uniref:Uncharacterized protein n=2 Tax=Pseudomonas phage PSV3 TaxID=3003632 RepID=A0AAF0AQ10_9CAUD|nr:hypothetical protein PM406_gp46 [Pseudomonas phage PSV3]YP_010598119.1 hypothetical protein PM408_gp35 [Pseudomonas phage PSV3]WBF76737.1 hypothetical protein PSV3_00035 [Pseudomonas phage PSV3]WBF76947.1 hypothetical protein PSV3_00245 [Pseudomonas phage PSV3]
MFDGKKQLRRKAHSFRQAFDFVRRSFFFVHLRQNRPVVEEYVSVRAKRLNRANAVVKIVGNRPRIQTVNFENDLVIRVTFAVKLRFDKRPVFEIERCRRRRKAEAG